MVFFFFFQAEDGIRDGHVTGVQTCALPISGGGFIGGLMTASAILVLYLVFDMKTITQAIPFNFTTIIGVGLLLAVSTGIRSEERRVGKECRGRMWRRCCKANAV